MNKWSELRETIRELHDNNADKPDVVGVTGFLLNLMNVKDRDCDLLKEQEPILLENQHKPYGISTNANSPWISRCPRCGKKVEGKQTRFCKYCGQAVKWE